MDDQASGIKPDSQPAEPSLVSSVPSQELPPNPSVSAPQPSTNESPNPNVLQQDTPQPSVAFNPIPSVQPQVTQPSLNTNLAPQPQVSPNQGGLNTPTKRHNKRKFIVPALTIIIIVAIIGAVLAFKSSGHSTKLDCVPLSGNTVTKTVAIAEFKNFAQAVRTSNQTCANSLSSNYFLDYSKQKFATQGGNWITSNPVGVGSMASSFSKLPKNLINSQFTEKSYTRAMVENSHGDNVSYYSPATGLTIGYPTGTREGNGNGGSTEFYFLVSFVSQKDKILVDAFIEGPADYF